MKCDDQPLTTLEPRIGHVFRDRKLLECALTHCSNRSPPGDSAPDNQRLEFLGDAVLGFLTASWFFERFPNAREGELSVLRSRVTCRKALVEIARSIRLGADLRMGSGEESSGGRNRESSLCDAMEALIGAAYLDGGMTAAHAVFTRLFHDHLQQAASPTVPDNPKGALQEYAQRVFGSTPEYHLISVHGSPHEPEFNCEVRVTDNLRNVGCGRSKQMAETEAARMLLRELSAEASRNEPVIPHATRC